MATFLHNYMYVDVLICTKSGMSSVLCTRVKLLYDYLIVVGNICGTPRDDCDEHATCKDVGSGRYTCTCNKGYTGSGKNCIGKNLRKNLHK